MPIAFACPCGQKLRAKDGSAGRAFRCPGCGERIEVPGESADLDFPDEPSDAPAAFGIRVSPAGWATWTPFLLAAVLLETPTLVWLSHRASARPPAIVESREIARPTPARPLDLVLDLGAKETEADIRRDEQAEPSFEERQDEATERAIRKAKRAEEEPVDRERHRFFGAPTAFVRLIAQKGLSRVAKIPEDRPDEPIPLGTMVALADDFVSEGSRDVILAESFTDLRRPFLAGLKYREECVTLGRAGRLFSVPRGTIARVIASRSFGTLWPEHDALQVQYGESKAMAWVPRVHCRTLGAATPRTKDQAPKR